MREKLKFEHLTIYLPYKVKVLVRYEEEDEQDFVGYLLGTVSGESFNVRDQEGETSLESIDTITPILKPLTELDYDKNPGYLHKLWKWDGRLNINDERLRDLGDLDSIEMDEGEMSLCTARSVVNNLREWHFDTDGLIDRGLTITEEELEEILIK